MFGRDDGAAMVVVVVVFHSMRDIKNCPKGIKHEGINQKGLVCVPFPVQGVNYADYLARL
jgi:hypothetical protein